MATLMRPDMEMIKTNWEKTILGNSPVTEDSQYLKSGGDDRNEKWNSMDYKFFIYYTQQKSYI